MYSPHSSAFAWRLGFWVQTGNIFYTIYRERCRSRLIELGEIGVAVPSLVRAGRPRFQEVVITPPL